MPKENEEPRVCCSIRKMKHCIFQLYVPSLFFVAGPFSTFIGIMQKLRSTSFGNKHRTVTIAMKESCIKPQ